MWQGHCYRLGIREGVGDLVGAVKECHRASRSQGSQGSQESEDIDWKRVYRELVSVISRIKAMVMAGTYCDHNCSWCGHQTHTHDMSSSF